jgi:hypothetical protein
MLKPRYGTINESVSDFNRMLDGMNRTQPLEPPKPGSQPLSESAPAVYQADADMRELLDSMWFYMPGGLKREIHGLYAEEQMLADIHDKVTNGHIGLTEADRLAIATRHNKMVERYSVMSSEFARLSNTAKSEAEKRNYGAMSGSAGRKAKIHERHSIGFTQGQAALTESQDPAFMSRYRNKDSALQSYRVLAGLDEQVMMPRDPGVFGTTRFNEGYEEMAGQSLDEGGPSRKSKEGRQMAHYGKDLPADMRPRNKDPKDYTKMEKDVIKQKMRPADEETEYSEDEVPYALERFASR